MIALPQPQRSNPRGIPEVPFLEKIGNYVHNAEEAQQLLQQFDQMHRKFSFMENHKAQDEKKLIQSKVNLDETLCALRGLKDANAPFKTWYRLLDTIYGEALIEPTKTVYLWLNEEIMVEYSLDEALSLVETRSKENAEETVAVQEDREWLCKGLTTITVTIARIRNWVYENVKQD